MMHIGAQVQFTKGRMAQPMLVHGWPSVAQVCTQLCYSILVWANVVLVYRTTLLHGPLPVTSASSLAGCMGQIAEVTASHTGLALVPLVPALG